jgi:hypothetical protein
VYEILLFPPVSRGGKVTDFKIKFDLVEGKCNNNNNSSASQAGTLRLSYKRRFLLCEQKADSL